METDPYAEKAYNRAASGGPIYTRAQEFVRMWEKLSEQERQQAGRMMAQMGAEATKSRMADAAEQSQVYDPNQGATGCSAQELSLANIEDAMQYKPWGPHEIQCGDQVREVLTMAAKVILRLVPHSPRRTKALNHLIDARMDANAAISFGGRF